MNETWKPIEGYEGYYEVSDFGRVRSVDRVVITKNNKTLVFKGKIKSVQLTPDGFYYKTDLYKNNKAQKCFIHRLVALHFVEGYSPGLEVRHGPKGSKVNTPDNLTWGTSSENKYDKNRDGTNHQRNKTHCPNNHKLEVPNIRRSNLLMGTRVCLACDRAKSTLYNRKVRNNEEYTSSDIKRVADEKYLVIMSDLI